MSGLRRAAAAVSAVALMGFVSAKAQESAPGRSVGDALIGIDAFEALRSRGAVETVDVRLASEFRAAHIPGAISIPLQEIGGRADEIKRYAQGRPVVTCCACRDEHASLEAARILVSCGVLNARALKGGYAGWAAWCETAGRGCRSGRILGRP